MGNTPFATETSAVDVPLCNNTINLLGSADHDVFVPSVFKNLPVFVDCDGAKALNAALAVVCPVPPLLIPNVPAKVTTPVDAVEGVSPLNDVWNDVTPELVADNVPAENDNPVPTVTLLKPPEPLPYKIDVPLVAGALLLNVVQSVELNQPFVDPLDCVMLTVKLGYVPVTLTGLVPDIATV